MVTLSPTLRRTARKILIGIFWRNVYARNIRSWPRGTTHWDQKLQIFPRLNKADKSRARFIKGDRAALSMEVRDWENDNRGLEISDSGCVVLGLAEGLQDLVNKGDMTLENARKRMLRDYAHVL